MVALGQWMRNNGYRVDKPNIVGIRFLALLLLNLLIFLPLAESPLKAADQRQEIAEKRGQYTKVYDNGDGTETLELCGESIHYQDDNGQWLPIDTAITSDATLSGFGYAAKKNRFQVYFANKSPQPQRFQMGDRWIEFHAKQVNNVQVQVKDNRALYPNAWDKADLMYTVFPDFVKEEIFLHDKTVPTSYTFQVKMQGVRAEPVESGGIGLYDAKEDYLVWFIPEAFAYDSRQNPDGTPASYSTVQMAWKNSGNNVFIELNLDPEWLADPARVFPVIIDPTVTAVANNGQRSQSVTIPYAQKVRYDWNIWVPDNSGHSADSWVKLSTTPGGTDIFQKAKDTAGSISGTGWYETKDRQTLYLNTDPGWYKIPLFWFDLWRAGEASISLTYNDGDATREVTADNGTRSATAIIPMAQTVSIDWSITVPGSFSQIEMPWVKVGTAPGKSDVVWATHGWAGTGGDTYPGSRTYEAQGNQPLYLAVYPGYYCFVPIFSYGSGSASVTVTYENPPPKVTPLQPLGNAYINQAQPVFQWKYEDRFLNPQVRFEVETARDQSFIAGKQTQYVSPPVAQQTPAGSQAQYQWPVKMAEGSWYWRVRGHNGEQWSSWSTPQAFNVDVTAPSVPDGVKTLSQDRAVLLEWRAATDNLSGIKQYELQVLIGGQWQSLAMLTSVALSYTHSSLEVNQLLDYRLRAIDVAGNVSSWVEFKGATASAVSGITSATPGGTLQGGYFVNLNFLSVMASGYQVRRTNPEGSIVVMPVVAEPALKDTTSLVPHGKYKYAIRTVNPLGQAGEFSPEVQVTIPNNLPSPVNGVTPLNGDYTASSQVSLQTTIPEDADGDAIQVQIRLSLNPDLSQPVWDSQWSPVNPEYMPVLLTPELQEQTYYWGVWAWDGLDTVGPGRVQSFTVDFTIPQWVSLPGGQELVTNTGKISVPWISAMAGNAYFTLVNSAGQVVRKEALACVQGDNTYNLTLPLEGVYALSIYVVNDTGHRSSSEVQPIRYNKRPEAEMQEVAPVRKGETVEFTASLKDYDGAIASYVWDFGDGSAKVEGGSATSPLQAKHFYTQTGSYTVTLTLTDNDGRQGTSQITVTVTNTHAGTLFLDEEWSGTWEVTGDVIVPAGRTLTVREGSVILVAPGKTLKVEGKLVVQGTTSQPVQFQGAQSPSDPMTLDESTRWQGILIYTASPEQSTLQYAEITGAIRGVAVIRGSAALDNVSFSGNIVGLHAYAASPEINNCRFTENALYGIKEDAGAAPVVKGCEFSGNGVGGYYDEMETIITIERLNEMSPNGDNR